LSRGPPMYELAQVGEFFVAPLSLALAIWLASGVCWALGLRRCAAALAVLAFAGLWVASTPYVAVALARSLESRYPAFPVEDAPVGDAILVLGGALAGARPPERPSFVLGGSAGRIWQAAALYRAGKGKYVVIAAGGEPTAPGEQVEADAIAQMLEGLGVPASALRLERESRNTRENAANVLPVLVALQARRVLLVTSAIHMPRAMKTFEKVWPVGKTGCPELIPVTADVVVLSDGNISLKSFLPAVGALQSVTRALKEFAGMVALAII
jgi:uncharacterized SAM-binding protein YcdF (DUF218 family)